MKNTMKKMLAAILAVIMIAGVLAGCSGGDSKSSAKTGKNSTYAYLVDTTDLEKPSLDLKNPTGQLKKVLDAGVLTIATSPDYPPAEFVTEDGKVFGSEMMLAKYVADCLGVDLAIESMDFNATLTAVSTGKVNIAFSGYGWKADRAESYELSAGYTGGDDINYHTIIVPAGQEGNYKSFADFVGKHIIAQASSLQQMYTEDQVIALNPDGGTELELVTSLDQAVLALASGKCDAVAMDGSTAKMYVEQSDGKFAETGLHFDLTMYGEHEGNVAAAQKGETAFMEVINQCINMAMDKGYYETFYQTAKEQAGITDEDE